MSFHLIAPIAGSIPSSLSNVVSNPDEYENMIAAVQRFRGQVYYDDQAIPYSAIDKDGRHFSSIDYYSWHIIFRDHGEQLAGIMRIPVYAASTDVQQLILYNAVMRAGPDVRKTLFLTLTDFVSNARLKYSLLAEPGGLAISHRFRNTSIGAKVAAGGMAVMQLLGNAAALSNVTVKHNASRLVKSIVYGSSSQSFYDSYHKCNLELIFYYSDLVKPDFFSTVTKLKKEFESALVLTR